ncbi:hypothetical protein E3O42_04165 [Cryobacterium adonitolivorans]|uniref:Uncharacterized protein n=1 Tax=Cryobacterium adonitolivorans TaxID=1259189 RepID=A0A4R8W905_9MICO|nr:hypothetical protein [Cryobacterium adonitolivorans]TFC05056.1 hypothetical protein E3O42_04165 [Cryobacterium adonitolivorans]
MRNDLTLSALRDVVTPLLAPTVQEVSFVTEESYSTWTLHSGATGITCKVEHSGIWYVQLDDWYLLELFPVGETRLVAFLIALDINPIHLVTARIGTKVVGSWLRFSGGMEFEDPTRRDKRITRTPGYSLDVTPWVTGNERMDLLPY